MLNLEVTTKLSLEETGRRVTEFFGKKGLGLNITEDEPTRKCFDGGGGYVTIDLCAENNKTKLNLVTQEWEYQVKEFASNLS